MLLLWLCKDETADCNDLILCTERSTGAGLTDGDELTLLLNNATSSSESQLRLFLDGAKKNTHYESSIKYLAAL